MTKLDLTKKHKSYYTAKPKPELVDLDEVNYLSLHGKGDPSSPDYAEKISALYTTAYTLKFMCKEEGRDFVVAKLEGQWWYDEDRYKNISMDDAPIQIPRSEWLYRMLIRLPDFVDDPMINRSIEKVLIKKNLPLVKEVSLFTIKPTKAVQMLHVGPFDKEPETLKVMMDFIQKKNLSRNGLHQEIYLSDFRKTVPSKLKTILREPVK